MKFYEHQNCLPKEQLKVWVYNDAWQQMARGKITFK